MQGDLQRELEQLGFTQRQACVYITLLRFGKSGVQQLALATGLPRASCYDMLQQLVAQGLVKAWSDGGQQLFVTEPLDRISTMLALQLEEVQTRRRRADIFLPQLEALTGDGATKPRFRIVNDTEELGSIHNEYAVLDKPLLQLVGYDAFLNFHRDTTVPENAERRQEKGARGRAILVTDLPIDAPTGSGLEVRRVPKSMMDVRGEMTVCEDRVLLFAYTQNVVAIEIISPVIADTCRGVLELAWQRAGDIERQLLGWQ